MTADKRTRTVAISGGGIAAFAAAIAVRKALPESQVTLFHGDDEADEPDYAGAAASYIHQFHGLVGIDGGLFRNRTGAVVAPEAEIRRAGAAPFRFVPFAEIQHVDGAALHQLWLRLTASERASCPSWADVARRGRRQDDAAHGLGVRFDARAYIALLRDVATQVGTSISADTATPEDLAPSTDLVIDARNLRNTDAGWTRIAGLPARSDWSWQAVAPVGPPVVETVEFTASDVRWRNGAWEAQAPIEPEGAEAGRLIAPMRGNILAVGRAALQCETFDGQPLAAALADIVRALHLLPRPGASGREAAEYNRRSGAIHDFLLDWAAERWGVATVPAGLSALRSQFEERGRIPFRDEDPLPSGHWLSWLLGRGVRPRHIDLTARAMPEERLVGFFAGV